MCNLVTSSAARLLLLAPLAILTSPATATAAPIELTLAQWTTLTAA
jgi:hypothetical protein